MLDSPYQGVKLGTVLGIHYAQATEGTGDGAPTLALKPMGGVNQSLKQKVPVAPQNGDIVTAKKT